MRIVHLSDLHLGFRAYEATDRVWNLRERDLAGAFRRALQEIARLDPGLVLISGDLFDRPDPPSTALLTATRAFSTLRAQLPGVPVLVIAGERDSPASPADPGPVAVLDAISGLEAAAGAPRAVRFRELGLHVLLVPHRSTVEPPVPEIRPDPEARWNVLVMRGRPGREGSIRIEPREWDYVAIGGPHAAHTWAPNVRAAGALERPGWDPWAATLEERGFIVFDLDGGRAEFHPVSGRAVVDLAPVRVAPQDPEAGTRRLRELLQGVPGGIEGKLIRIPLRGDVSSPGDGVSRGLLDAVRARAAHLEIELRGPESGGSDPGRAERPTEREKAWSPRTLLLPSGPDGSREAVPLEGEGLVLLTAGAEALRARVVAELAGSDAAAAPAGEEGPGVAVEPAAPLDARRLGLWAGHRDPRALLESILTGGGEDGAGGPDRGRPAGGAGDPEEVESLELELRELRADSIEASGDLEARMLEWVRERQDADSNLQAYRTRARELQSRIRELEADGAEAECPTCGRPLGECREDLLSTLEEEMEAVVQDGRWWRSRREQLDGKPEDIRELEARVLRLHARVEDAAEQAQRARDGVLPAVGIVRESGYRGTGSRMGREGAVAAVAGSRVRNVLRDAGTLLGRLTEGRLEGIRVGGRGLRVVDREGTTRNAVGAEAAALRFAVHLALWRDADRGGGGVGGLLAWEFHRTGSDAVALPALELLADLAASGVPVLVVAPPSVADRMPEAFREVVELTAAPSGRIESRRQPVGAASLVLSPSPAGVSRSEPH